MRSGCPQPRESKDTDDSKLAGYFSNEGKKSPKPWSAAPKSEMTAYLRCLDYAFPRHSRPTARFEANRKGEGGTVLPDPNGAGFHIFIPKGEGTATRHFMKRPTGGEGTTEKGDFGARFYYELVLPGERSGGIFSVTFPKDASKPAVVREEYENQDQVGAKLTRIELPPGERDLPPVLEEPMNTRDRLGMDREYPIFDVRLH